MTEIWNSDRKLRIIVAGSRNLRNVELIRDCIDLGLSRIMDRTAIDTSLIEIVSGCCPTGPDNVAIDLANEYGLSLKRFPADWRQFGKVAGPIRNKQMANYADALLLIWDGKSRGSLNMKTTWLNKNNAGIFIEHIID